MLKTYLVRIVKHNVVQTDVDLVQKPIMNEIAPLRRSMEHSPLRQK